MKNKEVINPQAKELFKVILSGEFTKDFKRSLDPIFNTVKARVSEKTGMEGPELNAYMKENVEMVFVSHKAHKELVDGAAKYEKRTAFEYKDTGERILEVESIISLKDVGPGYECNIHHNEIL